MKTTITAAEVKAAFRRAAAALRANYDLLTELDQALGDGDLGITANKVAETLLAHVEIAEPDLGKWLAQGGMAVNRAASSTMGTLIATALMRAGKDIRGKESLVPADLARMLQMADLGIQERGKAHLGDKTVIDVIHPASEAFAAALAEGVGLAEAGARMAAAARFGRDRMTPLRNRVGRASWQGERTEGKPDPGCTMAMVVLEAIAGVGE
jgi:dihydroxyacetone kinase